MRIGTGKCLNGKCGREVVVMETSGGAVNWSCRYCGLTSYAKKSTDANANLRELMTPAKPAEPGAPEPKAKKLPWMP